MGKRQGKGRIKRWLMIGKKKDFHHLVPVLESEKLTYG